MSEVIMVLEEPWYNTLTEQMFEQVIEEIQPESTELYKMLLPNISIGGVQFATIYYYD